MGKANMTKPVVGLLVWSNSACKRIGHAVHSFGGKGTAAEKD